ncbi:hypothetical protein [Longimicrobium terrae]|uniref:Uncharacterized protein n=1 Tax=Longimicrobium terrae TaxID=1639882 RepID=A0A841GK00_9BACT|nr:hypothetical protein [Longimicrobium terrae]MBB4634069.1 hypothetical protein [Longimicrobium terrae]MBB6069041.1 hypothetical protein [Longimicrobium terrae]NNC28218.1 hypothetical protein [Longimicrobium terrae]
MPAEARRIAAIVSDLRTAITQAENLYDRVILSGLLDYGDEDLDRQNVEWWIEIVFLKILAAAGFLGLTSIESLVKTDLDTAKDGGANGFTKIETGPDEPFSKWLSRLRQYTAAIEVLGEVQSVHSITKDVAEILRACQYSILDAKVYPEPPRSEDEVHRRIEAVLRCVFPDLKHKPMLTKPIKNYQPDTGLPSIRTLIEYKYLTKAAEAPIIADQILADTRGYHSRDWDTFIYVVYETRRIKPESEWNQLLTESGLANNTTAIVISGEPAPDEASPLERKSRGSGRRGVAPAPPSDWGHVGDE